MSGTEQPTWAPPPQPNNPDFRSQALNALILASCDADEAQHRQSELARIRAEVMDIAREVANLRQHPVRRAHDAMTDHGRAANRPNPPAREPRRNVAQAPIIHVGHKQRERPHPHARSAATEPTAPAREQWPLLAIGDDVAQGQPLKAKPAPVSKAPPVKPKIAIKAPARTQDAKPVRRRGLRLAVKASLFAALVLAGTAAIALALQGRLPVLAFEPLKISRLLFDNAFSGTDAIAARPAQSQLASAADQTASLYPFDMPDTYGVYAVGDGGQLTALESLPIRIPDARIAVSSAITKPPSAPVTNGTPLFVVYHRELATSVPESASVRVFAKVMQASTIVGGKPKAIPVADSWAVRGGAIDLRIAPVAANKEMILIRPADPNFTLPPGRYVLMFKNQAYDFSVAGTVSDTAQCLERSDLQDGPAYSECRELPAAVPKS